MGRYSYYQVDDSTDITGLSVYQVGDRLGDCLSHQEATLATIAKAKVHQEVLTLALAGVLLKDRDECLAHVPGGRIVRLWRQHGDIHSALVPTIEVSGLKWPEPEPDPERLPTAEPGPTDAANAELVAAFALPGGGGDAA